MLVEGENAELKEQAEALKQKLVDTNSELKRKVS
jgi:hypothetical protein